MREHPIVITGHKNPDTDSIASAIGYADFMSLKGYSTIPVRLGELSKETEFVLNYFNVKQPEYIGDIHLKVKDLALDTPITITQEETIAKAWSIMKGKAVKSIAVVDNAGHLIGIATLSDIAHKYMDLVSENNHKETSLVNILEVLNGQLITGDENNFSLSGKGEGLFRCTWLWGKCCF